MMGEAHHYIVTDRKRAWLYCDGEWVLLWGDDDPYTIFGYPPDEIHVMSDDSSEIVKGKAFTLYDFSDSDIGYHAGSGAKVVPL